MQATIPKRYDTGHEDFQTQTKRLTGEFFAAPSGRISKPHEDPWEDKSYFLFTVALASISQQTREQLRRELYHSCLGRRLLTMDDDTTRTATRYWYTFRLSSLDDAGSPDELAKIPDTTLWTDEKNEKRCYLIDKEIEGTITSREERELARLQSEMLAHRRKVAPLPLDEARELHQSLLMQATRRT